MDLYMIIGIVYKEQNMIKNFKLFVNNNDQSIRLAKLVKDSFVRNGYIFSDDSFDFDR